MVAIPSTYCNRCLWNAMRLEPIAETSHTICVSQVTWEFAAMDGKLEIEFYRFSKQFDPADSLSDH